MFKTNVTDLATDSLAIVSQLRPRHFYWDTKAWTNKAFTAELQCGLIADEVETILPDAVYPVIDNGKGIDYRTIEIHVLKSVQQLIARIETLEAENAKRNDEIKALNARIAVLENQ